jgi:hypothetical protein
MIRFVLAVLLGGLTAYLFSFIIVMFLPWSPASARSVPNDDAIIKALADNVPEPGVYLFPAITRDGKTPTMEDMT